MQRLPINPASNSSATTPAGVAHEQLAGRAAWSKSKSEEVIACLWLIAGLLAWLASIKWLAWLLFAKAALDTLCAIAKAIEEITGGNEYENAAEKAGQREASDPPCASSTTPSAELSNPRSENGR